MFQPVVCYFLLLRKKKPAPITRRRLYICTVAHSFDVRYTSLHFPVDYFFFLISYFFLFWVEYEHYVYVACSQLFLGNAVPRPPSAKEEIPIK